MKNQLICKNILELHPTQLCIGFYEVQQKVNKIKKMNKKDLVTYLKEKQIPVVMGPNNVPYMIDRHHLVKALYELNINHVYLDIKADLSHLNTEEFFDVLDKAKWIYLFDSEGNGPMSRDQLPKTINLLKDDHYRSLSWLLRENKIYKKSKQPYAEFLWAQELRKHIKLKADLSNIQECYNEAVLLINKQPQLFSQLPGFL